MTYLILKLIHVASVVIFLGNITTGLFWARHAHKTRDLELIATTFGGIIRSDRLFTGPAVAGILISGFSAAIVARIPILATGWVFWPIVLFSVSGLVFAVRVAPLQRRIRDVACGVGKESAWQEYAGLYKRWEAWGLVALLAPVAALAFMVLKPSWPGI